MVILDLGKLGISSLPRSTLQSVMGYLGNNYRSRMYKCYVRNCPSSIAISWSIIKSFLEDVTVQKIKFEKDGDKPEILTHCNKKQVETKYGGSCPDLTDGFW